MGNEVYEILKERILYNQLKPGERLIETKIAKELDVSRTPVREALKQLEQEELVTYYPRRGSIVSEVSVRDGMDLYDIREYLEVLAVQDICVRSSNEEIEEMGLVIEEMDRKYEEKDYEALEKLMFDWTFGILNYIPNEHLSNFLGQIYQKLQRIGKLSLNNEKEIILAYEETKRLYRAIKLKDIEESKKLAKIHVINAKYRFMYNVKVNND